MCVAIGLSSRPAGCPRGRFYVWVFSFASTDSRRPLTFGVAPQNHGRRFFTQSVVGEGPLSFPPRQYRETIAPSISPRHHCQDAPNRFFGRCPSLTLGGNTNGNHQSARTRSSRTPRTATHHHGGRLRLCARQRLGRLHVPARLCPPRLRPQVDPPPRPFRFLRAHSSLHRLLALSPKHRPPAQAANSRRTPAQYTPPPASPF